MKPELEALYEDWQKHAFATPLIVALRPGQSPPLVRIPILFFAMIFNPPVNYAFVF